eukprot:Skav217675  [mRNA]  locus=scaffold2919:332465:337860:+ [translate_table: standard]
MLAARLHDNKLQMASDVEMEALGPCGRCSIVEVAQGQGKRCWAADPCDEMSVYGALVAYRGQAVFGLQLGEAARPAWDSMPVGPRAHVWSGAAWNLSGASGRIEHCSGVPSRHCLNRRISGCGKAVAFWRSLALETETL